MTDIDWDEQKHPVNALLIARFQIKNFNFGWYAGASGIFGKISGYPSGSFSHVPNI